MITKQISVFFFQETERQTFQPTPQWGYEVDAALIRWVEVESAVPVSVVLAFQFDQGDFPQANRKRISPFNFDLRVNVR